MLKSRIHIVLIITLLFAGAICSFAQTVPSKEQEAKLIAVLKSDAPQKEKADACRQLAVIGTKDAVSPLAALLADEKLSHMARYALEPIPEPAVDEALRDALGKLKGQPLVGVIGSIGVRHDEKAVGALAKMLQDNDAQVAQAAARALGKIGSTDAAEALQSALGKAPQANQLALYEGLFRCAEALADKGQRDKAIEIYDQLRSDQAPHQVRAGALRGAILTRGKDGVSLLRQHLRSDDYIMFSAAAQTALEMEGPEVTAALTAGLSRLPADNQILVLQTLGKRGDKEAVPALFIAARSGDKSVRLTAIKALPEIGHPSAVPVLVSLLTDADRQISQAAQESLSAISGQQADAVVLAMLDSGQTSQRLIALELIGRRRMTTSIPALLKAARDADPQVRQAAIKMVGELGGPEQFPSLLAQLMDLKQPQELAAAEQALTAICRKTEDPQSYADKLIDRLDEAGPAQKSALLRVLSAIGGTNALKAVRAAINDSNEQVHAAAFRAFCAWKTADAAPDLIVLAKGAPNTSEKIAALRSYISLVRDESISTDKKLTMCKQAAELIQRDEEKKLLLGVLATVPSAEALSMAMEHVDNPATKNEACFAAVEISEKIVQEKPGEDFGELSRVVADALQKVIKATDNKDVTRRARAILKKTMKKAGR